MWWAAKTEREGRGKEAQKWAKICKAVNTTRTLNRTVCGLLETFSWAVSIKDTQSDPATQKPAAEWALDSIQAGSMLAYYGFEHLTVLHEYELIKLSQPDRIGQISCIFWLIYTCAVLLSGLRQFSAYRPHTTDDAKRPLNLFSPVSLLSSFSASQHPLLNISFLSNSFWFPLALNWSWNFPLLSDETLALFGVLASVIKTGPRWSELLFS